MAKEDSIGAVEAAHANRLRQLLADLEILMKHPLVSKDFKEAVVEHGPAFTSPINQEEE